MEVGVHDREHEDNEREKVEARERRETKREQATHAQTCDVMADSKWSQKHLEPQCDVCTSSECSRKTLV